MVFLLLDLPEGRNMSVDSERIKYIVDHTRDTSENAAYGDAVATVHFIDDEAMDICQTADQVWKHATDTQAAEKQKVEEYVWRLKTSFEQYSQDCQVKGIKPQSPL
tara:strand:- start:145 stop:462 length:318 start_codon:yes stop_codon:yes gene_type:complete